MKTPKHWEKNNDWHHGICYSCMHNSHEKVKMRKEKIKRTGRPDCKDEVEVWICPVCGYCREL
jgi:hypothetical protein